MSFAAQPGDLNLLRSAALVHFVGNWVGEGRFILLMGMCFKLWRNNLFEILWVVITCGLSYKLCNQIGHSITDRLFIFGCYGARRMIRPTSPALSTLYLYSVYLESCEYSNSRMSLEIYDTSYGTVCNGLATYPDYILHIIHS